MSSSTVGPQKKVFFVSSAISGFFFPLMAKIPAIIAKLAVNLPFVTKDLAADEGVELVSAALVMGVLAPAELVAGVVTVAAPVEVPVAAPDPDAAVPITVPYLH